MNPNIRADEIVAAFQRYLTTDEKSEISSFKLNELKSADEQYGDRDVNANFRIALRNRINELNECKEQRRQRFMQGITVALSLIALGVSVRSCQVSDKAVLVAESQAIEEKLTNFIGTYSEEKKILHFQATNPNATLQRLKVYYPSIISEHEWDVEQPDFNLHVTLLSLRLQELVKAKFPWREGYSQVVDNSSVPIVVESHYLAKGGALSEKALYVIEYEAFVSVEKALEPSVDIKGLSFLERLPWSVEPSRYLDQLWVQDGS